MKRVNFDFKTSRVNQNQANSVQEQANSLKIKQTRSKLEKII